MFYFLFQFDGDCYVFNVLQIVEVLFLVVIKLILGVLDWVVGVIEWYGVFVLVIDVFQFVLGCFVWLLCFMWLVFVCYEFGICGDEVLLLGLMFEYVMYM